MKASHRKTTVLVGFQNVELNPGQFVFGRRKAAAALSLSEMVVRRCLKSLKIADRITIKATNKFSILTIVNWDAYQSDECTNNQQTNQQRASEPTNSEPTTSQQRATNKNGKECRKNVKEYNTPPPPPKGEYSDDFLEFWKLYPRKEGKGAAYREWKKIKDKKTTLTKIQIALLWQKESEQWNKKNGDFIPHPRTYLSQRRWDDEKPEKETRWVV